MADERDEGRGDDVYQPANADLDNPPNDALDLENALDERDLDAVLDEGYSPPERPYAVEDYGTTQNEQHSGESLERRLTRERPDRAAGAPEDGDGIGDVAEGDGEPWYENEVGDVRSGRLTVTDDPDAHGNRTFGRDVGIDGGAASAEEAAVHTITDEDVFTGEG